MGARRRAVRRQSVLPPAAAGAQSQVGRRTGSEPRSEVKKTKKTPASARHRERPQSRCVCRERDGGPHSLLSTWDGGFIDDMPRADGHASGRLSRLVVKDPLLCMCLWETLMFIYRGN